MLFVIIPLWQLYALDIGDPLLLYFCCIALQTTALSMKDRFHPLFSTFHLFFRLFYELALLAMVLCFLPKMLYQLLKTGKYRKSVLRRFGLHFPDIQKEGRPLIWVHAVSFGETKAILPLVAQLAASLKKPKIIFSTATETGYEAASQHPMVDYPVFMPFDFGWLIRPLMRRLSLDLVILCESDFWYNFLDAAKSSGAKLILVNGKLSLRSQRRMLWLKALAKHLFAPFDLLCLQSGLYRERFLSLGIEDEKMVICGNMKLDARQEKLSPIEIIAKRQAFGINGDDSVIVIGSSHAPEEAMLLDLLPTLWLKDPHLKVIFVPRHPERFDEVAGLIHAKGIPFIRFSANQAFADEKKLLLVDAMGLLKECYQLATLAIVGGSYTDKVGGHNIIEPCWYGVPVVFGPFMHSQPDLVALVHEYSAGLQTPVAELRDTLCELLCNEERRLTLGEGGLRLVAEMQGATAKTMAHIARCTASSSLRI